MTHAEIQATTPFAGEFETYEGDLESEVGRRRAPMRTRPPMRRLRRRVLAPRRRPRLRPLAWPAWPPYAGGYPPLTVEGPGLAGGGTGSASDPDRMRCIEQCLRGSSGASAPPEAPPQGGDAGSG